MQKFIFAHSIVKKFVNAIKIRCSAINYCYVSCFMYSKMHSFFSALSFAGHIFFILMRSLLSLILSKWKGF